jgi:hypothetical protein
MYNTKHLIRAALIVAMGLVFPAIFHFTSINGQIFLPMHLPVLIGAAFVNPWIALLAGGLIPLVSSFATGMPPLMPIAILMTAELAAYGASMSWLIVKRHVNVYAALLVSMIIGRVVLGISAFLMASLFVVKLNPTLYLKGAVISGLPGIALQLILVPFVIKALSRSIHRK